MNKIILASASPRRSQLLEQINIDFTVNATHCDESYDINWSPQQVAKELSYKKAKACVEKTNETQDKLSQKNSIIIAADTIVCLENSILSKPKDEEDAYNILSMLSGKKHTVYTGVTIYDPKQDNYITNVCGTDVYMDILQSDEINYYISTKDCMDKAGAYGIQGYAARFIQKIDGCYYNVMGLPLNTLCAMLCSIGVKL